MKHKVTQISETLFEVLGHSVKLQKRKGRTLLLCSCTNSSRFANNNFCWHKELVLEYLNLKKINQKIDELIKQYSLKLPINSDVVLNDLRNLK